MRDAGNRSPPTAGFWFHNYEFLALGPGVINHGRGEEKPKVPEQLELSVRGRNKRGENCVGKIATIFVAVRPRSGYEELEGVFSP